MAIRLNSFGKLQKIKKMKKLNLAFDTFTYYS